MVKKIRFFWRLLLAFILRHKGIISTSFIFGGFFFFLIPWVLPLLPKPQETKTIGVVGRFSLESLPDDIQKQISLGLTHVKEDGTAAPSLASQWIVEDGGKTYTFKLAENRFWHDGTKVVTKDVNYNFKDVSVEVLDERTIKFKLQEPFTPFPVIVSRPLFKKGLIGTGDYKVDKLTRNGDYVNLIYLRSLDKKKPHLKYRFYPTEAAAKTALKLGEVRTLEKVVDPSGFEDWKNIKTQSQIKFDRYLAIFFDASKPYLNEKNFRQALAYALPKEKNQKRALGPISPFSWAYNSDVKPYEYDLENAKNLLSKAVEKNEEIKLTLATSPSLLTEAEKIKSAWNALGVQTEIEAMTSPNMEFQALLAIQEIPIDPDQYSLWHSSQKIANITHLDNKRIDSLLEEGRKAQDVEKRKQIYFDFQRFLVEEVPLIFLYHPTIYEITRK